MPTIEQSKKFTDDKSPEKREKLIDELLARETDYAANWTPFFEEAIASGPVQASIGTRGDYQSWIIDSFKQNRSWDVMFAQLVDPTAPGYVKKPLLPINGNKPERRVAGNLDGSEAAQLAHDIGARCVIPCHYEMFEFNTASPDAFVAEASRIGQRFRVMRCGESLRIVELPRP